MTASLRLVEWDEPPERKGTGEVLYRYEDVHYSCGVDQFDNPLPGCHIRVELREYPIMKRTPKGAWIKECWTGYERAIPLTPTRLERGEKFVLLSARKRFAAETKERALVDYKARKRRQIRILKARLLAAETALFAADRPNMEGFC